MDKEKNNIIKIYEDENILNKIEVKSKNKIVKSKNCYYEIHFNKNRFDLMVNKEYNKFIKATERLIRNSNEYKTYISYLKMNYNLINCAILGNVEEEMATIEMHHAILTLYDYCSILLEYLLDNEKNVNTFSLAKLVIKEHYNHNIVVVMLSKTLHELVHASKIVIKLDQTFGNLDRFIKKYNKYISDEYKLIINNYKELNKNDNIDLYNNIIYTDGNIENWSNKEVKPIIDIIEDKNNNYKLNNKIES